MPEGGPKKMKKKRLLWVGSALAVGLLALVTLMEREEETAPTGRGVGAQLSLSHFSSKESSPVGRNDPFRPVRGLNRRARRPAPPSRPVTGNRTKPRRPGIPLNEVLNPALQEDRTKSLTPAPGGRPEEVTRLREPVTPANLPAPRPGQRSPPDIAGPVANQDLAELEQGYQAAQARLFGGGGGGAFAPGTDDSDGADNGSDNPFDEALDDPGAPDDASDPGDSESGDPGDDSDAGDGGDSDNSSGDSGDPGGEGDSGDGDTGTGGDTGNSGGDAGDNGGGPIAPLFYDFLLTGPVGSPDGAPLHRAWRASNTVFVLEDPTEVIFQPGFTPFSIFEDQQLYLGDSDGDGDLDVTIVSLIPTLGSTVETFHQTANGFVLFASVLTYLKSVGCLEYFDFSGSDANELVLTFEGEPDLHTYEPIEGSWVYKSEIALSFTPGVLIKSQEGSGVSSSLLYIVSEDFESVANLLSIRPDLVRSSPDIPLTRKRFFNVSWREDISTEDENMMAIEMADKIVLIDLGPNRWKWNLTLGGPEFQRTIIGYYNDNRLRQTLWIP